MGEQEDWNKHIKCAIVPTDTPQITDGARRASPDPCWYLRSELITPSLSTITHCPHVNSCRDNTTHEADRGATIL